MGFCFRDLAGKLADLWSELGARILGLLHGTERKVVAVKFGQPVGDRSGQLRLLRLEFDDDATRIFQLIHAQCFAKRPQHALLVGLPDADCEQTDPVERPTKQALLGDHAVELGFGGQVELLCHLERQIRRLQGTHVRADRLLVHAYRDHLPAGGIAARLEGISQTLGDDLDLDLRCIFRRD